MKSGRRREAARLLLLGTYRPGELLENNHPLRAVTQELYAHRLGNELAIGLLSEGELQHYLDARFSPSAFPVSLTQMLYRRTEGNPLFLVRLLDELVERGVITQTADGWTARDGLETLEHSVPESLRQLLAKQGERLSPTV